MAQNDVEAFRFPEDILPVLGLTDEVDRLWDQGRFGSAVDVILRYLRTYGRSAAAFRWALPLLRATRTPDANIVEPVTDAQRGNPYFAPIATECARCQSYWYSGHVLVREHRMTVTNPIGRQCQSCRFTLCRDCFTLDDVRCPEEGCFGELGVPVLPTGRPRGLPANRHTEKIEHVIILWEGEPTELGELTRLLDLACTWQDFAGIRVMSQEADLDREAGDLLLAACELNGVVSPRALDRTRGLRIDSPGLGRRQLLITAAPATGPASRLSGPISYTVARKPRNASRRGWFRRVN
ncbi:hypothetical protein [Amycolatopsis sp. NPDC059021]|uniref:hypothetical protein n=1 Tax=Amycolatopsis sp. NPDC059021 TaxID=3346704 RepID=UPI00366D2653